MGSARLAFIGPNRAGRVCSYQHARHVRLQPRQLRHRLIAHLRRIPRHHDIRQQRQCAGELPSAPGVNARAWRGSAVVDGPLRFVHRLALVEHPLQFVTEAWVAQQITEIDCAQNLAQRIATLVSRIAPGQGSSGSEPFSAGACWPDNLAATTSPLRLLRSPTASCIL